MLNSIFIHNTLVQQTRSRWGRPKWIGRRTSLKAARPDFFRGVGWTTTLIMKCPSTPRPVRAARRVAIVATCELTRRWPILQTGQMASYGSKLFAGGVHAGSTLGGVLPAPGGCGSIGTQNDAAGEHKQQKTPDELDGVQRHLFHLVVVFQIAPAEANAPLVQTQ